MKREEKIYQQAIESVGNVSFDDLCYLAMSVGFEFARQAGTSHRIYKHPRIKDMYDAMLNIQEQSNGRAHPKQVRILLGIIDKYELMKKEGE
jgi:hypothetical protein